MATEQPNPALGTQTQTQVLIGRDELLAREIYPRVRKRKPFLLTGQRGIGKSEILCWAYNHFEGEKILLSARQSYGMIVRVIAEAQGNGKGIDRMKIHEIEKTILSGPKLTIFLDDFERATPKLLGLMTSLNERWVIYLAANEPIREEARRITWGKPILRLLPLAKRYRLALADHCVTLTGSLVPAMDIATACRGIPARALAIARGEIVRDEAERVRGEEINILPVLLLGVGAIMAVRYIARGIGSQDMYIMGGVGMGLAIVLRYMIFRGASTR